MIWVPIRGTHAEFPDHTLALSSCDTSRVDQLALDCLSFNAETLVSRLIWQNLDFVASQDPHHGDSTTLSSAINVYGGDVPALGASIFLRVASALPAAKRFILDYAREIVDFAKGAGVGPISGRPVAFSHMHNPPSLWIISDSSDRRLAGVHQRIRPRSRPSLGQAARGLCDHVGDAQGNRRRRILRIPQEAVHAALGAVFMVVEESVGKKTQAAVLA
jgi:hypothetical protein